MTPGRARAFRLKVAAISALTVATAVCLACDVLATPPQAQPDSHPPAAATPVPVEPPLESPFSVIEDYEPLESARDRGDVLSTLRPIVRRFDFESIDTGPNALPPSFFRYIAPSQGFPPFGEMRVTRGSGYVIGGAASDMAGALQLDLAGGSMSARIGTSVIPVLPYADYIVACRTRGSGLTHAKTRLVAWLCDATGREIPGSRSESRCAGAADAWETLSLEIQGRFADAADLVFELQLVQPQHQSSVHADAVPQVQDVTGRAWFDDVMISHMPRVTMFMPRGEGVLAPGMPAEFEVQVNEVATSDLNARLRVFDLDGHMIFDRVFPAPRGRQSANVLAAVSVCGWYRAVLDISSQQSVARRRWVDFVVVPPPHRDASGSHNPFGVLVGDLRDQASPASRELLQALGVGVAIVPAWDASTTLANCQAQVAIRRAFTDQLLRQGIDVHFGLSTIPDELARSAGPEGHSVLDLLAGNVRHWQPYLDELLLQYGLTVGGWQIGTCDDLAGVSEAETADVTARLQRATAALAEYAPDPLLHVLWPVQQPAIDTRTPAAIALFVPCQAQPSAITDFLAPWLAEGGRERSTTVSLQLLPAASYSPRQRVTDALLRGLHAWRAGAQTIVIDQPWSAKGAVKESANGADDVQMSPGPEFAAWRTLAEQLSGRTFEADLDLGQGVHGWVARGRDPSDSALITWCDRDASASPLSLQIQLASGAVEVIDAFGNTRTLEPQDGGLHNIALSELPVFIQHVSLELVMFRGGVRIEPGFVPAASKVHEHQIILRNPWDSAVAGTIRLASEADLALSPSVMEFSIPARGATQLPLSIIPQRGILAGRKVIDVDISLNADRLHSLHMQLEIEVGLKGVELTTTWAAVHNPTTGVEDLIISPAVTNRSAHAVNLDVDLLADGVGQMRRTIAGLQPGQTQTRTLRIPNGMALLAGKQIRLGVAERDGVARLNTVIAITPRATEAVAGVNP